MKEGGSRQRRGTKWHFCCFPDASLFQKQTCFFFSRRDRVAMVTVCYEKLEREPTGRRPSWPEVFLDTAAAA